MASGTSDAESSRSPYSRVHPFLPSRRARSGRRRTTRLAKTTIRVCSRPKEGLVCAYLLDGIVDVLIVDPVHVSKTDDVVEDLIQLLGAQLKTLVQQRATARLAFLLGFLHILLVLEPFQSPINNARSTYRHPLPRQTCGKTES